MKKILALLTAMILMLSACSSATVEGAGKEVEDTITNFTDADNRYVQMVKGGYRSDDPDTTYEDAFTAFFGTPRWKYFESEDGQDVVEFTGDCTYRDAPVKARIQFVVDEENGTFEATYLAFNEVPQDLLTLSAVISKAFEETETSTGSTTEATDTTVDTPASSNSDEIYYKDIPMSELLSATTDDVVKLLGVPVALDEEYCIYDDIRFVLSSAGLTTSVEVDDSSLCSMNGVTLNKNRDGLVEILGEPLREGDSVRGYSLSYELPYYNLHINMGEPQGTEWRVTVSR